MKLPSIKTGTNKLKAFIQKPRRLQTYVIAIFFVIFLCTVLTVTFYTYSQQKHSLLQMSHQLMSQNSTLINQDINDYLKPAAVTESVSRLLETGQLNLKNAPHLIGFMENILRSYPQLYSIYITDKHGNFIQEQRFLEHAAYTNPILRNSPKGTFCIATLQSPDMQERVIYKNKFGATLKEITAKSAFRPLERPWYLGVKQLKADGYLLDVYKFFDFDKPGITVAYPIKDKDGKFVGVAAADLFIEELNTFLQKNQLSKNSISFIVSHNGELIADSKPETDLSAKMNGKIELTPIVSLKIPQIVAAYQYFKQTQKKQFVYKSQGKTYIANFSIFSYGDTEQWLIGSVAPITDFIGPMQAQIRDTLLFSLLALILGIILIVYVAQKFTKPIAQLAKETHKIKHFHLDEPIHLQTYITEIIMMLDAINSMRTGLKSFSKYVPKDLVRQLIQTGEVAKLKTRRRDITLLFTDITGFSAIAEAMPTKELVQSLSKYLTTIADVIRKYNGTIDKYIGDAVMAFWGAPYPDKDHVSNGCKAALLCLKKIKALNTKWQKQNKPVFVTRMSLHTGKTLVGNLGSVDRINYTAVGDNVNLAARLEVLNKSLNTSIIVSEEVCLAVKKDFYLRPLLIVTVRGKHKSNMIYELVALKTIKTADDKKISATQKQIKWCDLSLEAFAAFKQEDWHLAVELYQNICDHFSDDVVAKWYVGQCIAKLK